jgi:formate--tetrahydrofolate ligase
MQAGQHAAPLSDLAIAQAAELMPIGELARDRLGIDPSRLIPYGHTKAKLPFDLLRELEPRPDGNLILVTAITPTPAGEGKTTTTVGLGDGLNRLGKSAIVCLREPSLGPCFGLKGGATGGGYAQVVPMDEINLHFTGDFHAIGAANNLLAALIDNHIHWGAEPRLDPRRVLWRRALDMNDRALRNIAIGLGGPANGFAREDGFDITVASEIMAIFCLANDVADLQNRLGRIVIGETRDRKLIRAADISAAGAMAALLKDALAPNLVQTLERNPAIVHGGPFANIAHGCNSLIATRTAPKLGDFVVTEAGFGADLGAEKFLDIKCRLGGLAPSCAVVVATVRALKMHGGVAKTALGAENLAAVREGFANLRRHCQNLAKFGLPVVVSVNRFSSDTRAELDLVAELCASEGVEAVVADHWAHGGAGAEALARAVLATIGTKPAKFRTLYPDGMPLLEKMRTIAGEIYRADDIAPEARVVARCSELEAAGFGDLPVCMAKTQYSFSADPNRKGAPEGFILPIREVRLSAGAGFVVALCGEIMTMPGLPRTPAANAISVGPDGRIVGLF